MAFASSTIIARRCSSRVSAPEKVNPTKRPRSAKRAASIEELPTGAIRIARPLAPADPVAGQLRPHHPQEDHREDDQQQGLGSDVPDEGEVETLGHRLLVACCCRRESTKARGASRASRPAESDAFRSVFGWSTTPRSLGHIIEPSIAPEVTVHPVPSVAHWRVVVFVSATVRLGPTQLAT